MALTPEAETTWSLLVNPAGTSVLRASFFRFKCQDVFFSLCFWRTKLEDEFGCSSSWLEGNPPLDSVLA